MQYIASAYIALNAPLKWALCVSPGQVRAGSLVSLKESSFSVKRQLWWGFFFSRGSLRSLCCATATLLLLIREPDRCLSWTDRKIKAANIWLYNIRTSATLMHFTWNRIEFQKGLFLQHLPCLSSGSDWLYKQANKTRWQLLWCVSEETWCASPCNILDSLFLVVVLYWYQSCNIIHVT